jgi:hypothetical protein
MHCAKPVPHPSNPALDTQIWPVGQSPSDLHCVAGATGPAAQIGDAVLQRTRTVLGVGDGTVQPVTTPPESPAMHCPVKVRLPVTAQVALHACPQVNEPPEHVANASAGANISANAKQTERILRISMPS